MKRVVILSLIFLFMTSPSVHALWDYWFVVWDGKEYEVKKDELIEESDIGRSIGKVKTQPHYERNSRIEPAPMLYYYGNASRGYPIGTRYFEIKGIPTYTAIAVKDGNQWVKAVYVQDAPYHFMSTFINLLIIVPFVIIPLIVIGFINRKKRFKEHVHALFINKLYQTQRSTLSRRLAELRKAR